MGKKTLLVVSAILIIVSVGGFLISISSSLKGKMVLYHLRETKQHSIHS